MADILTVADLESAKQDDTFHAEVITGKLGGNGADIDFATHARTGQIQMTLPAMIRNYGFGNSGLEFGGGGFLNSSNLLVKYNVDNSFYRYIGTGTFPIAIPAAPDSNWQEFLATVAGAISYNGSNVEDALDKLNNYADSIYLPTLSDAIASTKIAIGNLIYVEERESGKGGGNYWLAVDESTVTVNDVNIVQSSANASIALVQREWDVKPSIAFMFDDATLDHYDDILPLFESKGFPLAFAVCPKFTDEIAQTGTRLNIGKLLKSQKRGVEIVNHSMTHTNMAAINSAENVMAEVETARQWLEFNGLNNIGYVAASSAVNQDVLAPIYSRMAYACTVYANNDKDIATTKVGQSAYSLSRWSMDGVSSSATIAAIKDAIRWGRAIIVYDHDIPNPSSGYTNLVGVLNYLETIQDLIDVQLPKDLASRFCNSSNKQLQYKDETLVFNSTSGWSIPAGLGGTTTTSEIQLTPIATGAQTITRDYAIIADKTYTFSCNVRSGTWTGSVSMGVHYLDSSDAVISDYSVEGVGIEYDSESLRRYSVESHSPLNAVKIRLFFRINPSIVDGTTLLIKDPAIYTGRRILFKSETVSIIENTAYPFTPNLSFGVRNFFLRLDAASSTINAPTNANELDVITFHMRANGVNRATVWNSVFNLNPNTIFNTNTTSGVMIVQFKYYRNEWWQLADVAWV